MLQYKMDYDTALLWCKAAVVFMKKGIQFTVSDLFPKFYWDSLRIIGKNKGNLGKGFNKLAHKELIRFIKDLGEKEDTNVIRKSNNKTKKYDYNRQLYERI